jgi:hypothetical protein
MAHEKLGAPNRMIPAHITFFKSKGFKKVVNFPA